MDCPNPDRLIDLYHGRGETAEVNHVGECPTCQADLEVIFLLPAARASELELPRALVERALSGVAPPGTRPEREKVSLGQGMTSGILGTVTAAAALISSGAAGGGNPILLLLIPLAVGAAATFLQIRLDGWGNDLALNE